MSSFWEDFVEPLLGVLLFFCVIVGAIFFCRSQLDAMTANQVTYADYYAAKGITGQHKLAVLNPSGNELNGQFSGHAGYFLFMGGGSIQGTVRTGDVIQFEWVIPTGKSQIVEVPYDMIIWDFNDDYVQPTFEFNFTQERLGTYLNKNTEILNFNTIFQEAPAITIHCTRALYVQDVQSKIQK